MTPLSGLSARALIIGANLLTLAIAMQQFAGVGALLWPYYVQNLLIGTFTVQRMLTVRSGKAFWRKLAIAAFVVGYGVVHFAYWLFLRAVVPWQTGGDLLLTTSAFALAQFAAWHRQRVHDQGIDAVMLLLVIPFFRVFPIRGMVLFGSMLLLLAVNQSSRDVLIALVALKTAADWFALDAETSHPKAAAHRD